MARDALAGRTDGGTAPEPYQVIVHVDATALSGQGGESDLPLPTVRRLCCDGSIIPIIEGTDGTALNVGRQHRTPPTALKRALYARDRTCTFPGCHHERYLATHHIAHWIDGGPTNLDNLLVLCGTHHRLVHEGGFSVARDRDGGYYFVRPDGRPVEPPTAASSNQVEETRAQYHIVSPFRGMEYNGPTDRTPSAPSREIVAQFALARVLIAEGARERDAIDAALAVAD